MRPRSRWAQVQTTGGGQLAAAASLNVNLDQWANLAGQGWQNGDLNKNNSAYSEGDVVPFRLAIEGLAAGQHTIHLNYDFTAGGHEAYDFLATYNDSENPGLCSSGGGAVSSMCPSLPGADTEQFKSDPFEPASQAASTTKAGLTVAGAQAFAGVSRNLTMYGGTIDDLTVPTHSGPTNNQSSADITVTFTTTGSSALFAWGAHIAQSGYWVNKTGGPNGAARVSGAPWHMRTQNLDNSGNKNQDRSIQPSAIVEYPNVLVTKVADNATISAGQNAGFTIEVTNQGPGVATGVTLHDPLPAGVTWTESPDNPNCSITGGTLDCDFGDMAEAATASVHIVGATTAANCGTLTNTASVDALNEGDAFGGDNSATATITVQCPDIAISKVADKGTVSAGDQIGYTITVTNNGPGKAFDVVLHDTLPSNPGLAWTVQGTTGGWNCSITTGVLTCGGQGFTLNAGASATVHIVSPTTSATCGTVSNTGIADASNDAEVSTGVITITVQCAALVISKVADDAVVNAGDDIGYTITVTNNGAGTASNVVVHDTLPTNGGLSWTIDGGTGANLCSIANGALTCNFGTMGPGASYTVHLSSPTTSATCGQVVNAASATTSNDGNPSTGNVAITVNCPDVSVLKTADKATINAGDTAAFTIVVTNHGPGAAKNVTLNDPLPAGVAWTEDSQFCSITNNTLSCDFGTLGADETRTVHVSGVTDAADCGPLVNTATVSASNEATGDTKNNVSTATITVNCPNLVVLKTADDSEINAGDTAAFTITVTNNGDGTAYGVTLTDTLPAGVNWQTADQRCDITGGVLTCDLGDMGSGASTEVHVSGTTDAADCGVLHNTATVSSDNQAPISSSADITVDCPDISVVKTADDDTVDAADQVGFTITVANAGPGTAYDVMLADTLPTNDGLDWSIDGGTGAEFCDIANGELTCDFGDMGAKTSYTVHITSDTDATTCGEIDNTATVTIGNGDGASDDASITVNCPDLGIDIQKGGPIRAHVGDTVTYTFDVSLTTPEPLFDVTVTDPNCNEGAPVYVSGDDGDNVLEPGETWSYTCTHLVTADDPDPLPNTATVQGTADDGRSTTDEDSHEVDLIHPAIDIVKTVDPISGNPGDTVTYTYVVTNTGDTTLFNVSVDDDVIGHIGDIAELAPGESVTLTKDWVLPSNPPVVTNVGTATGTDVLGKTVSANDDANVTIVEAENPPKTPPPTAFTGSDAERLGLVALALLALGFLALAISRRRGRHEAV